MSTAVLTRSMQRREQARYGGTLDEARDRLAHRLKIAPGTIYNIVRDRLKRIDHETRERIVQFAIRDIQQEIARLTHELQNARQMGMAQN